MIALACDHGALDLKNAILAHLEKRGLACKDFGCFTKDSCDYPDFAAAAARAVASGECDRGIVCCTTGIGVGEMLALEIVDVWLDTEFSHGERHQRRIDKIMALEHE